MGKSRCTGVAQGASKQMERCTGRSNLGHDEEQPSFADSQVQGVRSFRGREDERFVSPGVIYVLDQKKLRLG